MNEAPTLDDIERELVSIIELIHRDAKKQAQPFVDKLVQIIQIRALRKPAPILYPLTQKPGGIVWLDEEPPHVMPGPMTFDGEAGR